MNHPPAGEPPTDEPPDNEPPDETTGVLALTRQIVEQGLAPNGEIVLQASVPLDPAFIAGNIELRDAVTTETLAAEVRYEADTRRIIIRSTSVFDVNKHYKVHVRELRDINGRPVTMTGPTIVRIRHLVYSRSVSYDENGNIRRFALLLPVPGGDEIRKDEYVGAGEDGDWETTADNILEYYEITRHDAEGGETKVRYDADGTFIQAWRWERNESGQETAYLLSGDAGDDQEPFTRDDDYISGTFTVYDNEGTALLSSWGSGPGQDGDWLTGDDTLAHYYRFEYDDDARLVHEIFFFGPGNDDAWFSPDDAIGGIDVHTYDADGRRIRTVILSDSGDGVWLNGNDEAYGASNFVKSDNERIDEFVRAGPDKRMDTPDDRFMNYRYRAYREDGRKIASGTFTDQGADLAWHTNDDFMDRGTVIRYELTENGGMEEYYVSIIDNGPNGMRFDGDELTTFYFVRVYDETSQLTSRRMYEAVDGPARFDSGTFRLINEHETLQVEE